MKFYTIFTSYFNSSKAIMFNSNAVNVAKDVKTGRYYCGGASLTALIFTRRNKTTVLVKSMSKFIG